MTGRSSVATHETMLTLNYICTLIVWEQPTGANCGLEPYAEVFAVQLDTIADANINLAAVKFSAPTGSNPDHWSDRPGLCH